MITCPDYTVTYKVPSADGIHASKDHYPDYSFVPEYTSVSTDYGDDSAG